MLYPLSYGRSRSPSVHTPEAAETPGFSEAVSGRLDAYATWRLNVPTYRRPMIASDHEGAAYRQLARILRDRIRSGQLPAGGRMQSEKDLHDEFGLARETVRRALAVLRAEGLVEVRHGHGTYVVEAPPIVDLFPGDTVTSSAALTVSRGNGDTRTYPAGTTLTVNTGRRP
jgi:DNA-binding transcriptional ArsR family regulator